MALAVCSNTVSLTDPQFNANIVGITLLLIALSGSDAANLFCASLSVVSKSVYGLHCAL